METALENTILDVLKQLCSGRGKQREVSEKFGISRQYLNKLLNGVAPISSISLETLQKMFPRVTFNLNGDAVSIHADQNSGAVVGVNRGHVSTAASESFRLRVLEAVIDLDIPSDALQIVLKTIKEIKP